VRAYPQSEAPGDLVGRAAPSCARRSPRGPPRFSRQGQLYASVFYEPRHGAHQQGPLETGRAATTRAACAARYRPALATGRARVDPPDYAWKLGSEEATADKEQARPLWLQGVCASDPAVRAYPVAPSGSKPTRKGHTVVATVCLRRRKQRCGARRWPETRQALPLASHQTCLKPDLRTICTGKPGQTNDPPDHIIADFCQPVGGAGRFAIPPAKDGVSVLR
jgi:hypothetical protein